MFSEKWNKNITLTFFDKAFAAPILALVPRRITPNHITLLRFALVFPVAYALYNERYAVGLALFVFAGITDAVDGAVARHRRQITEWGTLYDPLADKLLIGTVIVITSFAHLNAIIGVSLLFVEAVHVLGGWMHKRAGKIRPANAWGKTKMVAEVLGLSLLLLSLALSSSGHFVFAEAALVFAVIMAVISLLTP